MNTSIDRYVCLHGHFYQPPRENPWLEEIERQDSAHPFHDWNERIAEECYTPNAHARILDDHGRLREIVCTYEHMSFNFGPSLLSWLEKHAPFTYRAILQADATSRETRSGHGNALAQPYNHMIMPLASSRDKITQVVWGIEDFRARFQRNPEGMWLPETAVDAETLDILAQSGIRFTILAPRQALRFRSSHADDWVTVDGGAIDPSRPYVCSLQGGRTIVLFFYDAPISQAIAFERLLSNGDTFKNRILAAFSEDRTSPQLVHIATDGESYGHHHRFGEMALAYAIEKLLQDPTVRLTNYGEFLELHPPTAEAEFVSHSSWSCAHGVARWTDDCGCSLSHRPNWNQKWRAPLREALDLIRDRVDRLFIQKASPLLKDPWEARNRYIHLCIDKRAASRKFFRPLSAKRLTDRDLPILLKLLEIQRNRMLMYTSCGWFFDDILGIESLQVLRYAARVLQLAESLDPALLQDFLEVLSHAESNVKPNLRGDEIFIQKIWPLRADLARVAAHVGIFSVFENLPVRESFYCYDIRPKDFKRVESGERVLLVGCISVRSRITLASLDFLIAVIYFGGVDFRCSVRPFDNTTPRESLELDLQDTFRKQSSTELIRKLDTYFPGEYFALKDLFAEQRSQIIETLTGQMYEQQAGLFTAFYSKTKDLAELIMSQTGQISDTFLAAAGFVLNRALLHELQKLADGHFPDGLKPALEESRFWKIDLDLKSAEKLLLNRIIDLLLRLEDRPHDRDLPAEIIRFLDLARDLEIPLNLGEAQIVLLRIARSLGSDASGNKSEHLSELAHRLLVRLNRH